MVRGAENVVPPSTERLKTTCGTPIVSSAAHTRSISFDPSIVISTGHCTAGAVIAVEKVAPPSVERRRKMLGFPELLSNQAT